MGKTCSHNFYLIWHPAIITNWDSNLQSNPDFYLSSLNGWDSMSLINLHGYDLLVNFEKNFPHKNKKVTVQRILTPLTHCHYWTLWVHRAFSSTTLVSIFHSNLMPRVSPNRHFICPFHRWSVYHTEESFDYWHVPSV